MATVTQQRQLQRWLKFWQKKMRLTDWKITTKFSTFDEMNPTKEDKDDACQGHCDMNLHARTALIQILEPEDYGTKYEPSVPTDKQDVEDTLVHELTHLPLAYWDAEGTDNTMLEQAIETIAGALVSLKRRIK